MTISTDRLSHYLCNPPKTASESATFILQATADAHLYEFSELLTLPPIAALRNTDHHSSYELLRLFAYGTISDYVQSPTTFPPLSAAHLQKLRALTLVTLANGTNELAYDTLQKHLDLPTTRQVEAVVLDAVYAGLIRARMDQRAGRVEIASAVGRDVLMPGGITDMARGLTEWAKRSGKLIEEIDDKLKYIRAHTDARRKLA